MAMIRRTCHFAGHVQGVGFRYTAREIAQTGVDYISSGAITHSAPALNVALDF